MQLALAGLFAVDPRIPAAIVIGGVGVLMVLERPILGVGVLLAARLMSTGAMVFMRIGRIGIGPFEPALVLCLATLAVQAALHGRRLWRSWPWRIPFLAMVGWMGVSLAWSVDKGDGLGDILPMFIVLANTLVILAFVETWDDFRLMLWFWVGASVAIGLLTVVTDVLGIQTTSVTFKAAAGGGRETGLGQQPNWYAMNLMFIIHTCFGMALLEKRRWVRWGLIFAGFFIFLMMLKSGSRGGAYAILIGGVLAAMAHPLFRKWFIRFSVMTAVLVAIGIALNLADSQKALLRIVSNASLNQNYRPLNWLACWQMFRDTYGRGIGAGGYTELLPRYNYYVAESLYDYPHGIFWEIVAHYGVVGLSIMAWLGGSVVGMTRKIVRLARGTEAEVFAWTMPAAMLGYLAWSFVEFTLADKPFWEFLSLYTALYLVLKRLQAEGGPIPSWSARLPRLWGRRR